LNEFDDVLTHHATSFRKNNGGRVFANNSPPSVLRTLTPLRCFYAWLTASRKTKDGTVGVSIHDVPPGTNDPQLVYPTAWIESVVR